MRISVFGLGYVGTVGVGCLASLGHKMVGVDSNEVKVRLLNAGKSAIIEKQLTEIIADQHRCGAIEATTDAGRAVASSEVSFICVGTPSSREGHLSLDAIFKVGRQVGSALASKNGFHVVAIRSTVSPGTAEKLSSVIAEESGRRKDNDFGVVSNPEFLREGSAVDDFLRPPYTVLASSSARAIEVMKKVYEGISAPVIVTSVPVAEMLKYVNNSFHALKITFANEVGNICKRVGVDSRELMRVFALDSKLNISPCYLKPGFAYGGSCLPKDLKALSAMAHDLYLKCPVLESVPVSNEAQKELVLEQILSFEKQRIGFLGLSFKAGTDDLRSSPIIDVIEKLLGKGFEVQVYDKNVNLSRLMGSNREFIQRRIPYISRFIVNDARAVLEKSELIVVVNAENEFRELLCTPGDGKMVYDLVNLHLDDASSYPRYFGIAW